MILHIYIKLNRAPSSTSPHPGRVKTEHDEPSNDSRSQSRQPRSHPAPPRQDPDSRSMPSSASSPPSQPSPKKRRMTISGPSHPVDQVSPNPNASDNQAASPHSVVSVSPMDRDDQSAVEQARSVLTAKRDQEALIEKRRESLGGPLPSSSQTSVSPTVVKPLPGSSRSSARSPNMSVARTGRVGESPLGTNPVAPPSHSQQADPSSHPPHQNSLPPPPISFASRRSFKLSSSLRKKPADIVISPRDANTQPVIQSAPAHQGGRFQPMALPSLPKVHQPPGSRRIPGNVPPTPTRLTLRSSLAASASLATAPPTASVPISTILVPQTPAVFSRTDSASQRSAFLAPFEAIYDVLRDAKESKTWLAEQLTKVQTLQTGFEAAVEAAVERRVGGLREEVARLQRRVDELECSRGPELGPAALWRRRSIANGDLTIPENAPVRETYTFPPVHPRAEEGGAGDDSDVRETESPAPAFDLRRQSISAVRMDPPPPQPPQQQTDAQGSSSSVKSPSSAGVARRPSYQLLQPPLQRAASQPDSPVGTS